MISRTAAWIALSLAVLAAGCEQKWDMAERPVQDEELDAAFFSGLDSKEIADVPEPASLRPCCIFGNDVGAQVGSIPVPGYEITYTLELDTLGTHQFNKGTIALQPRGQERILSDEVSGILYTCRGGFIDIAHVRDNADRTLYLVSQIGRIAVTGGTIPISGEGAKRRVVVKPVDPRLVRTYGLREVVTSLAEWLDYQAGIWHEITTWYGWSSTPFSEQPSAFSPEDLYSNLVGAKIAGTIIRRQAAPSEVAYNRAVTALLRDALIKLGPKLYPWKLMDARSFSTLPAAQKEFDRYCRGDWKPLGLSIPDRLGDVPFRVMATLEIEPGELLVKNGFPFPKRGSTMVTQDDFPGVIAAIEREADKELGPGAGLPAARPNERSRYHQ